MPSTATVTRLDMATIADLSRRVTAGKLRGLRVSAYGGKFWSWDRWEVLVTPALRADKLGLDTTQAQWRTTWIGYEDDDVKPLGHSNHDGFLAAMGTVKRTLRGGTVEDIELAESVRQARGWLMEGYSDDSGDCYEAAANYVINHSGIVPFLVPPGATPNPKLILVHGEVTGQGRLEGTKYGHAWIEDSETVIDQSNGRDLRLPKMIYYAIARIVPEFPPFEPNLHKYTAEEARRNLLKYKHYGPWDLKTSTGL